MGQFVQKQISNQHPGDLRATIANKLAQMKPHTFIEIEYPTILQNWLREFDKFETTGTPDDQKVRQATFYLREQADTWWSSVGTTLRYKKGVGWEAFKTALRSIYYPSYLHRNKYNDFIYFQQGKRFVPEYAKEFEELSRFLPCLWLNKGIRQRNSRRALIMTSN